MIKWLKKHFIPHEENGYAPHFWGFKIVGVILGVLFAAETLYLVNAFFVLPTSDYFAAVLSSVLVDQTNEKRQEEKLNILIPNAKLEEIAKMKAEDMAMRGYFSHDTPDGLSPWYWFKKGGYEYSAAGENLAVNFVDSKDVTDAWMKSPSHRANIMNNKYTEIGIATAQGKYKGKDAIFVVQMFGRPSVRSLATSTATSSMTTPMTVKESTTAVVPKNKTLAVKIAFAPPTTNSATTAASSKEPLVIAENFSTTTAVAGAETFSTDTEEAPLGPTEGVRYTKATSWERLVASPRSVISSVLLIVLGILVVAFSLAVFINIRVQHPHIIFNGLFLVSIVLTFILFNLASGPELGSI